MPKKLFALALCFIFGIGVIGPNREVKADDSRILFDQNQPGAWNLKFQADPEMERDYALTKAENDYCRGKMMQLIGILKNNPGLSSPKGFNIRSYSRYIAPDEWYGQHKPPYKDLRIRMEFWASLPALYHEQGKLWEQHEPPYFMITFNEPFTFITYWELQYQGLWDEQGREIFLQPYSGRNLGGITVYEQGHTVIIAKRAKPLWIPVSQEQYLKAQLKHYQQKKITEPNGDVSMVINFIKERLNALSPSERKQIAYYTSGADDPTGLTSADDPGAFMLVTINPDYYDRSLSRTAIQLIVIKYGYNTINYDEADSMDFENFGTNKTLYDLERTLDYQAVTRLLD